MEGVHEGSAASGGRLRTLLTQHHADGLDHIAVIGRLDRNEGLVQPRKLVLGQKQRTLEQRRDTARSKDGSQHLVDLLQHRHDGGRDRRCFSTRSDLSFENCYGCG